MYATENSYIGGLMSTHSNALIRVASYSRYSTNLQDERSLDQQQNRCRGKAAQLGMAISSELEFSDAASSGTKHDRIGVNALIHAAESGLIDVIIVDSLSRLSREVCFTMNTLKNIITVHGVRFISVTEGIDSALGNWEVISMILGYGHEEFIKNLRSTVIRGQSDAHLNGYSTGTFPFGYKTVELPGTEFGRLKKLRKEIMPHEEHTQWVRKVFDWFVKDKMPIQQIAKELTRLEAPKDHRSTVSHWNHQSVSHMLSNGYYIGICAYGKKTNVRNPLTGKVRQKLRPVDEASKWITVREDLRIIDQETFDQAQEMLEENRKRYNKKRGKSGRFKGATNDIQNPRHHLQGLFVCSKCNSPFITHGAHYMQCKGNINGLCDVKTCLPRELAKKIIIENLQRLLEKNQPLVECLFETLKKSIEARKTNQPNEIESLTKNLKEVTSKINRLLDLFENLKEGNPEGQKDLLDKIKARTQEKRNYEKQLAMLSGSSKPSMPVPTLPLIQDKLNFIANAIGNDTLSKIPWNKILGIITLMEVDTIGHKRKHFAGFLKLETSRLLSLVTDGSEILSDGCDEEVLLDFIGDPDWFAFKDRIIELHAKRMKFREIGKALGCPRNWVTLALKAHAEESGIPYVDGRKLKKRLEKVTAAMKIADQAKALMDKGLLLQEIAKQLKCGRDAITAAIKHWYSSRGLPVPDGRTRRKSLERKSSKKKSD
jgi:DNA invertase Pin-like site-specific DNA recombinase